MSLYQKLPIDLQFKIFLLIQKEYRNTYLLLSIKENRKNIILNYIYSIFDIEIIGSELFFWFNKDYPKISNKYIFFFIKLFPGFLDFISYKKNTINTLNTTFFFTGLRERDNIYIYYKNKYCGYYLNFIQLILNKFSINDLEDFLNFLICKNYNEDINYSSICVKY